MYPPPLDRSEPSGNFILSDIRFSEVYRDLKLMAAARLKNSLLRSEISDSSLVHDALLRINAMESVRESKDRARFFATMTFVMRSVLVDRVRKKKRMSEYLQTSPESLASIQPSRSEVTVDELILDLDAALSKLQTVDPDSCHVAHLRLFGGLTFLEIAKILNTTERSTQRYWKFAKAWLGDELRMYRVRQNHE